MLIIWRHISSNYDWNIDCLLYIVIQVSHALPLLIAVKLNCWYAMTGPACSTLPVAFPIVKLMMIALARWLAITDSAELVAIAKSLPAPTLIAQMDSLARPLRILPRLLLVCWTIAQVRDSRISAHVTHLCRVVQFLQNHCNAFFFQTGSWFNNLILTYFDHMLVERMIIEVLIV